jgi:hypothetical protein
VRRIAPALVAGLLVLGATGCSEFLRQVTAPECEAEEGVATLVLMAQSVPSASLVPCILEYPAGWTYTGTEVRSGRSDIRFDHDRAGFGFLEVTMTESCPAVETSTIRSDEEGTTRLRSVEQVVGQFRGAWFYVFDGGCVTYRFDFDEADSDLQNEAAVALGFVTREHLADLVAERTVGDLELR